MNVTDYLQEPTCSGFRAVNMANKKGEGLAVSGVAGGVCRHTLMIPNSAVDLQKGERYVDMSRQSRP